MKHAIVLSDEIPGH